MFGIAKSRYATRARLFVGVAVVAVAASVAATVMVTGVAQADSERPFKGSASGVFTGPDSGVGTVVATHIGESDVVFSNLATDPAGAYPEGDTVCIPVVGGNQVFTAANGDEIAQKYVSGVICVDPVTTLPVNGTFTVEVTGGTGRFDDATGVIYIDAVAGEFPAWSSEFTEGSWISY